MVSDRLRTPALAVPLALGKSLELVAMIAAQISESARRMPKGQNSVCENSRIFVGRSFSYDINTAKSVRLQPLKYRFCSSHTDSEATPFQRAKLFIGSLPLSTPCKTARI